MRRTLLLGSNKNVWLRVMKKRNKETIKINLKTTTKPNKYFETFVKKIKNNLIFALIDKFVARFDTFNYELLKSWLIINRKC